MPINSAGAGKHGKRFRQIADTRWLMSYAAGLGLADDCYLDTTSDIVAHPLFPVCLEWPVILDVPNIEHAGDTSAGERGQGVHALHDMQLHRPIVAGEALFTSLTLAGIEARKPGAFQSMRIDTVDQQGDPVVTTWQGTLYRGVAVVGGDRVAEWPVAPVQPDVPEPGPIAEVPVLAGAAHTYTECAQIFNPIHTDKAVAVAAGLPDLILHGTATLAHAVNVIVATLLPGQPQRVTRIRGRFAGMVLMPGLLEVRITHVAPSGCFFEVLETAHKSEVVVIRDGYVGFVDREGESTTK